MGKLTGKVAIVTGGSRGQGASHVRTFLEEGAKVVFTDIIEDAGEALAKELGEDVKFVKHDVSNAQDWERVVKITEELFGNVNILVNNAGIAHSSRIEDHTEEAYRKVIDVNQVGTFLGMKAVISSMKETGNGSIINVSSTEGFRGSGDQIAYVASKFAVRGMSKSAAMDFAEYGIRVNSVHPGMIQTPILEEDTEEYLDKLKQSIPMGRAGESKEASKLVLFLASDDSSYSTGSEFTIDGGLTASN